MSQRIWRLTELYGAPVARHFKVRCPDGRVRWVMDRSACGFSMSAHPQTTRLWWHDLIDWSQVGVGPATWDWSHHTPCRFVAPNGRRCGLPSGHVFYLKIGHRLSSGRRFVARVTSYWPMQDPKMAA